MGSQELTKYDQSGGRQVFLAAGMLHFALYMCAAYAVLCMLLEPFE